MDLEQVLVIRDTVRREVGRVVVGHERVLDLLLVGLLSGGHVLLEGVPGTAKTLLAQTFARVLALDFTRIQFTPDLMPGDVLGTNLFNFQTNQFVLSKGPIFTQVLLADEINRTPPKTQSALLQAMQERAVTLDGTSHALGPAFMVVATQNPIEHEGTYPLPEAQLDRFLFKVDVGYPSRRDELAMVRLHGHLTAMPQLDDFHLEVQLSFDMLLAARRRIAEIRLSDEVAEYVVDLVRATREERALLCGASPRAANMLAAASRAQAAVSGRDFVIPDDVKALLQPTLRHRLVMAPASEIEGLTADVVLRRIVERIPAPR